MLLTVLVLGLCGLPYSAAVHVLEDHADVTKGNLTSARFYTLNEALPAPSLSGTPISGSAIWNRDDGPIMKIQYHGTRGGFESVNHDFDVMLHKESSYSDSGYSVVFRDTSMNVGFGTHFYQKFAILPKGETDKKKALFTIKMETPHFNTGAKVWQVSRGYCNAFRCYGEGASRRPVRNAYCLPAVKVVKRMGRGADRELADDEMRMWSPRVPYWCHWNKPEVKSRKYKGYAEKDPLSYEYGGAGEATVEEDWAGAMHQGYAWPKDPRETGLFLTIATALTEAFKVGGSGN